MRFIWSLILVFLTLFVIVGYLFSDALYYKKLIKINGLITAKDAFNFVRTNNPSAINDTRTIPAPYVSPKYNLENKRTLYCDEGATALATLDQKLGYKTRLVNLIGTDNISHHTILEVFENGRWVTYDYFKGYYNKSYNFCAGYRLIGVNKKIYPGLYNFLINNNYFLKKAAFFIRGIHEN